MARSSLVFRFVPWLAELAFLASRCPGFAGAAHRTQNPISENRVASCIPPFRTFPGRPPHVPLQARFALGNLDSAIELCVY